ncbi:unnamed protein product [Parnassius apollo]|uniref:(apollo) hypothetical protein n=1 Tax=Parnassius apollo TaxID=110799 RepID=A0A8S3WAE5_PARAO|nr:unnamed protein product [Parnassius apollo]
MFYGHVFCSECFKAHVLCKYRNECPRMHSKSWWMQWAPGTKPQQNMDTTSNGGKPPESAPKEPPKHSVCTRCLQPVDDSDKVDIGGQNFHRQCAMCYFCHEIPSSNLKIYYGQVFCEACFHRHVLNRCEDNPSEFFKHCFDQWQNNAQFAENMRQFMNGSKESAPFVFMMQNPQPPFCRYGTGRQKWFQQNEPKKSQDTISIDGDSFGSCDLSPQLRTNLLEVSESSCPIKESASKENSSMDDAQKIEKLTKYLQKKDYVSKSENSDKNWKIFNEFDSISLTSKSDLPFSGWVDLQAPKMYDTTLKCPKCLWQCGPIYVNSECLQNEIVCGDN